MSNQNKETENQFNIINKPPHLVSAKDLKDFWYVFLITEQEIKTIVGIYFSVVI